MGCYQLCAVHESGEPWHHFRRQWFGAGHQRKFMSTRPADQSCFYATFSRTPQGTGHKTMVVEKIIIPNLYKIAGSSLAFTRLGGLSGAAAMCLLVYHTHLPNVVEDYDDPKVDMRRVFETTNRYHLIHSLALMAVPLVRHPIFVSTLSVCWGKIICHFFF